MQLKMFLRTTSFALATLLTLNAQAGMITNGDFSSCDYSDWQTFTDFDPGSTNDFSIKNNGSTCSAEIQVDHYDISGAPINDAWFFNSLTQALDFRGDLTSSWLLTIDFAVDSELTNADPAFIADNFSFGVKDGSGTYFNEQHNAGYLMSPKDINGEFNDIVTFELSSAFSNISGLILDMQLNVGADAAGWTDAYGSTLFINNVSLVEKLANISQVPEPSILAVLGIGLVGLIRRKSIKSNKQ